MRSLPLSAVLFAGFIAAAHGLVAGGLAPSVRPMRAAQQQLPTRPALASRRSPDGALMFFGGGEPGKKGGGLPFLIDPGTKGGIVFWSVVLIALPFIAYNFMLESLGWDVVLAGNVILVGYVGLGTVLWTSSYVFRVANKDMTYAKQLRDYENAVIQKRFEELSGDEVDALMGEIYPGGSKPTAGGPAAPPPPASRPDAGE